MSDFLNLIEEFKTSVFNFNVICGIIAAVVVFILEIIFIRKRNKTSWKIEKAKSLGHVVQGKRVKAWDDDTSGYSVDSWFHATYVFTVDGKEYKCRYLGKVSPPLVTNVYYINSPRKAFVENEYKQNYLSILLYIIPVAVAILVINCLGGV